MSILLHRLMPLFKLCFIIGICSFTINPKSSTIFKCTTTSLMYSIFFSANAITITSLTVTWTAFDDIQMHGYYPTINNINDILQIFSIWIMYHFTLILSIKNRQAHVLFLKRFNRLDDDLQLLCTKHILGMPNNSTINRLYCLLLALVVLCYALSTVFLYFADPRTDWINKCYPLLSILRHLTNLTIEIYLKFFVVAQINLQSTVNRLFAKTLSESCVVKSFAAFLDFTYALEGLKQAFGCAFNQHLGLAELRQFSATLMVAFGLVSNFRNADKLWQAPAASIGLVSIGFFFVNNAILVHEIDRWENQVSCFICALL